MTIRRTQAALLAVVVAGVLAIAIPALAADPSPVPGQGGRPDEPPGRANQKEKVPGEPVTVNGVIAESTDEKGRPAWTLTADGVTWELSGGPKWFLGQNDPLAAWVGQNVEVSGTHRPGATERKLDVETINGEPLREPGRPPWAGGPGELGEGHPGWKEWKESADRANGRPDSPPGQNKDKERGGAEEESGG